ncbi:S1 family peptidase [Algoriphagus zhangzhouensis]|uniref:Trypsin-like peptidase domain-containing protein n=1 Tax=Algoriphagus zhangzhouensis TaxID=1073327 RepID=A0A1M7Z8J7_9BACT|nr:serine protease [Algoriphagus zhangzhouensis]TDY47574.1 trypsin-like peptidase [Algoriphagus zhangzhouensis]SHO61273.1 Trypsin-like peptidase domain-containing protein [Algoriphagus zhangzhouensis]
MKFTGIPSLLAIFKEINSSKMFVKAIQEVSGFTRAVHSISRSFGSNQIQRGSATLFFINNDGWALTCKHVAQWISQAEKINQRFTSFQQQSHEMNGKQQNNLAKSLGLTPQSTAEMRITFVDCIDKMSNLKFISHPDYDLALIQFAGFDKLLINNTPKFLENDQAVQPGAMLCRLGFPFPEFSNFKFNPEKQVLEWTQEGAARSPRFPIEGMVTRFLGGKGGKVYGIEMSTPGLRGQSGGPLFDTEGRIIGMQSRTKHLHLGFDIEDKEIVAHGKSKKINDYAFIHLGECIHVSVIKEFLNQHQINFEKA